MENKNESRELFETIPVPQAVRIMAVPMIISQLIVLIYNTADTFYVGRINNPYMVAGISMVLPVFNIALSISGLAGIGGGSLMSRLLGKYDEDEARRVSVFSIYLSILVAVLFAVLMSFFMDPVLSLLGAGGETLIYARQYAFCVIVLGGIPTVLSNVFSNLVRSIGYSRQASFGIAMGGVLNIGFDPLFMFVLMPSGYEALGAGLATLLSNSLACIYFFITVYRTRAEHVISMNPKWGLPRAESIRSVFAVGIPSSLATLLFDLDYVVLDRLMVTYGDIALAAIGIVVKVERLPLNVGVGLCQGMVPLVAYNFSSQNYKRMDAIRDYSVKVGLIIGFASIVVYELGAPWLLRFIIADPETVRLGTLFLRIRILATPFMFLCFSTVHMFNAFGDGKLSLFLAVFRWLIVNIPMLFILNAVFGIFGLAWSQLISDIFVAAISYVIYFRYRRK